MKNFLIHCLLAGSLLMSPMAALADPSVHAHAGSRSGPQGGSASGAHGSAGVPGYGRAAAGAGTVTSKSGYTASGANSHGHVYGKGGYNSSAAKWNGKNSSGQAAGHTTYKKGQGVSNQGSAQVTNKNTGQTYGGTESTTYNKQTGGSTTVDTNSGQTYTKTYKPVP